MVLKRSRTRPTNGFYYVLHLSSFIFQCQFLHARGVPLLECTNGTKVRTQCSSTSACHSAWPYVTVENAGCCVLQLLGLAQFEMIPRNPQIGQKFKFANWGEFRGCVWTLIISQLFLDAPHPSAHLMTGRAPQSWAFFKTTFQLVLKLNLQPSSTRQELLAHVSVSERMREDACSRAILELQLPECAGSRFSEELKHLRRIN